MWAFRKRDGLLIGAASILCVVLYSLGTTRIYSYADDSLPFAYIVYKNPVVIVHHLVLLVLHQLNHLLGFTGPADYPKSIQLFKTYTVCSSGLGLALVGVLARRWFGSLRAALIALFSVAFTYGFWSYSIVCDMYVPAIAFTLLAVYLADKSYEAVSTRAGYGFLAVASVAVLIASLNHQSHSLVTLTITAVLLLARRRELPRALRLRRASMFFTLTAAQGLAVFHWAYRVAHVGVSFLTFVRGYEAWMRLSPWDGLQWRTPVYAALGIVRAVSYPEYALHFTPIYERAHRAFGIKFLFDDRYLIRELPDWWIRLLLALLATILVTLAVQLVRALIAIRRDPPRAPGFHMLAHWIWLQALFFSSWEPTSNEFWIWLLPCLGLLLAKPAAAAHGRRAALAWLLPAALLLVNLPVVSRYWSAENCIYRVNKTYLAGVRPTDLVVTKSSYPFGFLDLLEGPGVRMHGFGEGAFSFADTTLRRKLEDVRREGGRVVIDPMLIMTDDSEDQLRFFAYRMTRDSVDREFRKLESFCAGNGVPLLGVVRKGGDVIQYRPTRFSGYLQWVDARLIPMGPVEPRPPGRR